MIFRIYDFFLVLSIGNHHYCHSDHDFNDHDLYDDHDLKDDDHDTCSLQRSCRMLVRHDGVLCLKLGGLNMKILLMMITEHYYDGQ